MMPVAEVEYVRTFARVAQVQLRSILDALAEQVDKLGEVSPSQPEASSQVSKQDGVSIAAWRTWQVDTPHMRRPDHGA
jgi:cell division initiation protein